MRRCGLAVEGWRWPASERVAPWPAAQTGLTAQCRHERPVTARRLALGCAGRLRLWMQRLAQRPTLPPQQELGQNWRLRLRWRSKVGEASSQAGRAASAELESCQHGCPCGG